MSDDTRPFPIQRDGSDGEASTVPWWLAEIAYVEYAREFGTRQTLERLAERGGFGRQELINLIRGDWSKPTCTCPADGIYAGCPIHGRNGTPR